MTNDFDAAFNSFLDSENEAFEQAEVEASNPKYAREKFSCDSCGGSGLWRSGRANRNGNAKCNTCHGKGYLVTSPEARAKARASSRKRKADNAAANKDANLEVIGGIDRFKALHGAAEWSSFANSLVNQHIEGKSWSSKQAASINSMLDKLEAKAAERAKEKAAKEAAAPEVDLQAIEDLFETAFNSGYKKPSFRAEGLILKLAPARGNNAGAIYVMDDDKKEYGMYGEKASYAGKVKDAKFFEVKATEDYVLPALMRIAKDPLETALRYGRRTGRCACCGRELTKHSSIDAGIGPICAAKWGLA